MFKTGHTLEESHRQGRHFPAVHAWKNCALCQAAIRETLPPCFCGEDSTVVNERGEAVCAEHADKEQCAAGAERDYQLRDTPVPFEF